MTRAARVSTNAYRAFYGDRASETDGVVVFRADEAPGSPMLNRVVGLGTSGPATEAQLDAAIAGLEGTTFYVAVAPDAEPAELPDWLATRGLEPGWGWRQFERGLEPVAGAETSLRLEEVADTRAAADFAGIVLRGYGLPESAEPWLATAVEAPGWTMWVAYDGDEPAGAAGVYVEDGAGYLGFAATLPEHRRKGAQNALLAARVERAREFGCDLLLTETGDRRDDLPGNSYRNILRAGFREGNVVANWVRAEPA